MNQLTRLVLLAVLSLAHALHAGVADDYLRSIRQVGLDPDRCYRVRDVLLEREDIKLYFTDGYLIFGEKVQGRDIAFAFVATEPTDTGELLLIPPTPGERQSVARFLDETVLDEQFRTGAFFFTDDSAEALMIAIEKNESSRLDAEAGARLAPRWSTVVRNLLGGAALRVFEDTYSNAPLDQGFFAGAMRGRKLGRFDVSIDPRLERQVTAGQFVRDGKRDFYEVWTNFEGKNFSRGVRKITPTAGLLTNYRIESRINSDLHLDVSARADFYPQNSRTRSFDFELSGRLKVSAVMLDGEPVEFLQKELPFASASSRRQNNVVVVVLPEPLELESKHELEFQYSGKVISDAGNGVYYVGDRGTWYPRAEIGFSQYELEFRYPAHMKLVATGTQLEDAVDGGMQTTRFKTESPIRLAGFNLGHYISASREVDGYTIEVHATETVEPRLRPRPPRVRMPLPTQPATRPNRRRSGYGIRAPQPPLVMDVPPRRDVSPTPRVEEVADQSAAAFQFFAEKFGEPAQKHVVVSPVPGDFGQGFPGLVYASTKSYFRPGDQPLKGLTSEEARFYTKLLTPHELAHQWWGNVVTVSQPGDAWMMEGLATYSALLFLEQQEGRDALDQALAGYRRRLLESGDDGAPLDSAGPVVLGERLRTSHQPQAYRIIAYEKGAWIFHMLRGAMGDERFFAFLRDLRDSFAFSSITQDELRQTAIRHIPAEYPDPQLQEFFDLWVERTGIPRITVDYTQKSRNGKHYLTASLRQGAIDERFSVVVPLKITTSPGRFLEKYIVTDGGETEFSVVLRNKATRVQIDPDGYLLLAK